MTAPTIEHQHSSQKDDHQHISTTFTERCSLWPGQGFSLDIKRVLMEKQSKFQKVFVFESTNYGNVLVLDGIIQATERDEFAYQEMMAHVPLNCHPNPENVLVIGGGDGGVLREIIKHQSCVQSVTLVEIDELVVEAAKAYLPGMAIGFDHPLVNLVIGDGFEYLKNHENQFDVIITDSSDPIGPAESLFKNEFFVLLERALKPGGIVCAQGESQWLHLPLIKNVMNTYKTIFPTVQYAWSSVPTYPSGNMGYVLARKESTTNDKDSLSMPVRYKEEEMSSNKYYNKEIHSASFALPEYVKRELYQH